MYIFYRPTAKEALTARNDVFIQRGIPALLDNGFTKSPYRSSWYGRDDTDDYSYLHCKLIGQSMIIHLKTYIIKGDVWIQNYLNIFELNPGITSLHQLTNNDSMNYWIPPSSLTKMRLKVDGYNLIPIIRDLTEKQHKIKSYYTERGFRKRVEELGDVIEDDFKKINFFINRWLSIHKPIQTDWNGNAPDS